MHLPWVRKNWCCSSHLFCSLAQREILQQCLCCLRSCSLAGKLPLVSWVSCSAELSMVFIWMTSMQSPPIVKTDVKPMPWNWWPCWQTKLRTFARGCREANRKHCTASTCFLCLPFVGSFSCYLSTRPNYLSGRPSILSQNNENTR